jgi:hypothetical protein
VVEKLDASARPALEKRRRKLSGAQSRAFTLLHEAINSGGGEIPPASNHIPANTHCVVEELWRDYCYQGGISTGDQHAKQVAFTRAVEALLGDGRVGSWDGWYWPVSGT